MIEELSERIWSHSQFHEDLSELRRFNLQKRYIGTPAQKDLNEDALLKLLRCAAILSASEDREYREAAFQIATAAAELLGREFPGVHHVLVLALSRIGNFPALSYAKRLYMVSEDQLPTQLAVESYIRNTLNTVRLGSDEITLTDFQAKLWRELQKGSSIGVSAPTSAGKSFILQSYAQKKILDGTFKNVAFLVPTRALINQVSEEIAYWISSHDIQSELITTPIPSEAKLPERGIFVVTQERMQLIQMTHQQLSFDLMLVDEAQSIGDGPRGVLLFSVIEEALRRNIDMQLLFSGPNLSEPGEIASVFQKKSISLQTQESTVDQNIIFADCDNIRPRRANLFLRCESKKIELGPVECAQPLLDHNSKLINIALRLGNDGQNLIYALGPDECERIAFGLSDGQESSISIEYLSDLSDFIKDAVHEKYQLANSVLKGVGFHYGRQPSLVRKAIEDAFSGGYLNYLVTTSTLLYGVNLPARNLFLHNPEKGKNQPISPIDFWNLAGRAGRLGKEFSGNIFLVDYGQWQNDPLSGEKELSVEPAIKRHVTDDVSELISYINDPDFVPDRNKSDEFENTFVKLVRDQFEGRLDNTLDRLGVKADQPNRHKLVAAVQESMVDKDIDVSVLTASPTVSIHRQQSLYDRLDKSLKKKDPGYIIPKHPQDSAAYNSYLASIKRCHDEILKYDKNDKSHIYYARMALRWMKGMSLPQIIDASYKHKVKQGANPNIASVIRSTLSEIERDLRFKYVRLFSCYNAVLEAVLRNNQMDDLIPSIPSIPMYLEVGACSPTMISFMGLGLSRYTAGKLQKLPHRKDMSQQEARAWILNQQIDSLDLPSASISEIRRFMPTS